MGAVVAVVFTVAAEVAVFMAAVGLARVSGVAVALPGVLAERLRAHFHDPALTGIAATARGLTE